MAEAKFCLDEALKSAQWERCKGELRALVNMQGSYSGGANRPGEPNETYRRYSELEELVEEFVGKVEAEELHR